MSASSLWPLGARGWRVVVFSLLWEVEVEVEEEVLLKVWWEW